MTDASQQSFSADAAAETIAARRPKSLKQRFPAPIWQFRPTLPRVSVVKTIKTQIIPKIVLALRKAPVPKAEMADHNGLGAVEQFAVLALGNDDSAPFAYVEDLVA